KNRVDIGCQSNAVTDAVASGRVEMAVRLHQTHGHRCYGGALASILMRDRVRLVWRADTDAEPVYGMYKGDHDAGGTDDDDYDSDDDGDDDCQDRALATLTAVLEYPGLMEPRRLAASIDRALYFAVLRGFIEVVKALHERWGARLNDDGPPPGQSYRDDLNFEDPVSAAAKCNDVRMLKYMTTHGGVVLGTDPLDVAARAGALPAVKYLVSVLNAPCSTRALDWAAASGHDNTVAYLLDKRAADCDLVSALTAAIAGKSNAVVSVLLEHVSAEDIVGVLHGVTLARADHERLCRALVLRGHTDVERFPLPTPGGAPGVEVMRHSIRKASGDPDALRAIIAAHPDVARRAYHGIGVHDWTAMEGATGALVVLHEYGIGTITHRAMCNAAFNGHVETMRTLFNIYGSTGPWVGRNLDESVANGHQGVLRFMQDNFDWRWWTPRAVDKAAADGRISAVRFLYAHRPTDDSPWCTEVAMDAALDRGHWEMAAFLHAAGARCSPKGLEAAKPPCGCRWVPLLVEAIVARCRPSDP
ncbi:MAG TPA: ankyrin repeat domain-containing protein, partial [Rariglobus sp.]